MIAKNFISVLQLNQKFSKIVSRWGSPNAVHVMWTAYVAPEKRSIKEASMITTTYISHNHSMPEHITELYLSEHTCRGVVRSVGGFPFSGFLRAPLARLEACKTDFSLSHSPLQLMWIMLYGFFTRRCLSEQLLWNGSQHVDASESFLAFKLYSYLPLALRLFFLLVILPS